MSKNAKELKDRVASFRIPRAIDNKVEEQLQKSPIINVDSANKFYRKLALDWQAGRLSYKNPDDLKADPEVLAQMEALSQPATA